MLSFSLFDQSIPSILSGAFNEEAGAGLWSFVLVVDSLYELVAGTGRSAAGWLWLCHWLVGSVL